VRRAIRKHIGDFLAMVALVVIAVGIAAYILSKERLRFPLIEEKPFTLAAELPDAQAVLPGQGQTVRVAGVRVGDIGDVEVEDGRAVVELQMLPRHKGLIRRDATALLRSKTGLKDMFIEVDPGEGKPLEEGDRILVRNTAPDVDPDEILSALDADTRDYLRLLIAGGGKGLAGRGDDLRQTFQALGPTHRDLSRVTTAIARRRANLRRLVHSYGLLTTELASKDREITRLVQSANAVLGSFAAEDQNVSGAVARLPGALRETQSTLVKVDALGQRLGPTLESLRPAVRRLEPANRALLPLAREGTPIVRDQIRPFARVAQPFVGDLGQGARGLARAAPDLSESFLELNRLFNIGAYNPGGAEGLTGNLRRDRARSEGFLYWLGWLANNTNSLFSTADANGPFRRITLGGVNCAVIGSLFEQAGVPAPTATALAGVLGDLGACAR
jgi:phospholipid/cholesterol/gamma-HCH transport system substrate-binding protein